MRIRFFMIFVLLLSLRATVASACGDCEDEHCALGICGCTPRLNCFIPTPPPGIPGVPGVPGVPGIPGIPGTAGSPFIQLPPAFSNEANQIIKNAQTNVVEKLGADTLRTVKNAAGSSLKTLQKAGGDTINTLQKAKSDTIKTVENAGKDATATYVKGWKDAAEQSKKSFNDAMDAAKAMTNFEKNQLAAQRDALSNANKQLRDGKVVDAMWGLATDPPKASEKNFFQATQESTLVNQAAGTAASVYGGPAGAAAYAAWQTYRTTGDANMAFRAGLMAGATAEMGSSVAKMPTGTAGEIFKKAVMAGTAGGIAVAAAGGDEQAIKDGFLKSAGAVLIQGGHDKLKAYSPKMADAYDTVQCVSARDMDCLQKTTWVRDAKGKILYDEHGKPRFEKLDPKNYSGKWTQEDPNSPIGKARKFIALISKLPNSESIPVLKNKWVLTWTAGKDQTIPYGRPTVVLTYVGDNVPFVSTNEYGILPAAAPGAPVAPGTKTYRCPFEGNNRIVNVNTTTTGCTAVYTREDGKRQTVWESEHDPGICTPKAAQFVVYLSQLGIHCSAQP